MGHDPGCGDDLPAGGTEPVLYLFNQEEVDDIAEDAQGTITSITMDAGEKAYKFLGFGNDMKKTDEVADPGIGAKQLLHAISWVIYARTQEMKEQIERIIRKKFYAVIPNNGRDGAAWEFYGKKVGLSIVAGPIRNSHENGSYFVINLKTPDGQFEPRLPQTFMTDYETAKDALDALTV